MKNSKNSKLKIFKDKTIEERISLSKKLKEDHQDYIPCVVIQDWNDSILKLVINGNSTLHDLLYIVRKKTISLKPSQSLIITVFHNEKVNLISGSILLKQIYKDYCSEDGFLYFHSLFETTFG